MMSINEARALERELQARFIAFAQEQKEEAWRATTHFAPEGLKVTACGLLVSRAGWSRDIKAFVESPAQRVCRICLVAAPAPGTRVKADLLPKCGVCGQLPGLCTGSMPAPGSTWERRGPWGQQEHTFKGYVGGCCFAYVWEDTGGTRFHVPLHAPTWSLVP